LLKRTGLMTSAPHIRADHVPEQLPLLALEALQLQLADRGEVGGAGVELHAGQQRVGLEVLEAGDLRRVGTPEHAVRRRASASLQRCAKVRERGHQRHRLERRW
jgi:hypothetical protein